MPLILTPFRFPQFRLWAAANSISVVGLWMQVLAASWLLLTATGSATQMGLGLLGQAVPALLLGPLAGTVADRVPAKPLLTLTLMLQAAVSITLGVVAFGDDATLPAVYAAMLVSGVLATFAYPSLGRLGSLTVDGSHLSHALAAGALSNAAGRVIGMSLGGIVVATVGTGPAFLITAAALATAVGVLHLMGGRAPDTGHRDGAADAAAPPATVWAGLRYLMRDPMVVITLGLAFLLGVIARSYQVTMASMSNGPLNGGPDGFGKLSIAFAAGTIVGGVLAGRAGRFRFRHLVLVAVAMSVVEALSGLAPGMLVFAAALLPIAAAAVVAETVIATRLQLDQPLAVRGRVLAVLGATGAVAGTVGAPALGLVSDVLGPRGALGVIGVIAVVGSVLAGVGYATVQQRRERGATVGTR
jgi:MFS family permease